MSSKFVLICVIVSIYACFVHGAPLYVAVGGSSSTCTSSAAPCGNINAAISVATDGDQIILASGNYPASGNSNFFLSTPINLEITGAGQGATTIDLEGLGRFARVDVGVNLTVSRMTLRNGFSPIEDGNYYGGCFFAAPGSYLQLSYLDAISCVVPVGGGYSSTGGTLYSNDATVSMEHMFVQGSRAPVAGGFYYQGNSNVTMHNVTVLDSQCTLTGCWGGAIVPESHTQLTITDSAFIECMAPQGFGGAIDDGTVANWTVRNTLFLRNRATYGGAIYNFGSTTSYFYNCSFIDNVADNNGGAVKPSSNTFVYFEGCLFQGNRASSNAGVGPASDCTATRTYCAVFKDSIFRANYAASIGGGMAIVSNTWIENVVFEDNWSLDVAGGLYLYLPYTTYLSNLTFINNTAPNGGAMFIEGLTEFEFNGPTTLINNSAKYIQLSGAATGVGGGFGVQGLTQVRFKGPVTVIGGAAANGGGASIAGASTVIFEDTVTFERNHAVNGGGLFVGSSASVNFTRGGTIKDNSATSYGGAIYHDGASYLYAPSMSIQNNEARFGAGYSSGISLQYCPDLEDSVFDSNTASTVGGALYLAVTSIQCSCENCTLTGNYAPTGSGITGEPATVVPTNTIPSSVTASEEFSASFILNDVYGSQSAAQDRVVTATITSFTLPDGTTSSKRAAQEVTLRGPNVAYFVANTASFGVLKLSGPPGSSAILTFDASPAIDNPYSVQMTIEPCNDGFVEMEIDGTYYCLKANRVSKVTRIVITVMAAVCIVLGLMVLGWLIYHRNKAAIRKSSVLFCILTTIGAIFMFVAAIMWVFVSDATCALRVWLLIVGFVLCYGSIFVKEYRLWLIFDETDIMRTVRVTDGLLLKVVFGGLAIELLITMIWFIVTPFLKRVTIDLVEEEISYRCTSTVTPAFFWILFALNMVLLLIGCILAWLARNVPANFNEAKQILFSIYNVTLTSIIVVVLGQVFRHTSEAISLTVSIGLMFSSIVTLAILFVPKIRHVADKEAVKRAIMKEIAGLERDIAWKKRMLNEVDSSYNAKTATASRKRTATASGSASAH